MALDLTKLNQEQKKAVQHATGPLLIVAGAGTGKTTVITDRIVYLIENGLAKPEEILAVTFTDKASTEMEERVDIALDFGYTDIWISTFHSFSERVLRDNGLDIGLPNFKLLDETSSKVLMRQNIDKFEFKYYKPLGNPARIISSMLNHFSKCKDQMIYPADYLKYADTLKSSLNELPEESEEGRVIEIANAYHAYQQILLENNYLDFGDLINYCLQLFQKRPNILQKYRDKFKYILVDEFQDTNKAQYELIKLLAAPRNNLTVTADDDQSVYKWRGASVSNIKQFKKDYPKASLVCLTNNYRSGQEILDIAYSFIQANNPNRLEYIAKIDKKLKSQIKEKSFVKYLNFASQEEEAKGVALTIKSILEKDETASFSDFAILVRANDTASSFTRALEREGLAYQFLASRGLYQKPVILDAISYLKMLDDYHESLSLYRVLKLPCLEISSDDIMLITQESHKKAQSVYETLNRAALVKGLSKKGLENIAFLLSLIEKHSREAKEKSASEVLVAFLNDIGYLEHLVKNDKQAEIDLLAQFYEKIKAFEASSFDVSLKSFLNQLAWEIEGGEEGKLNFDASSSPDEIKVMTIHSAKGLEFKYVFLVGLVDRRFPTIERKDPIEIPQELAREEMPEGNVHLEEERRLFYVAMTRAKIGLFLTTARNYGGKQEKKPSVFLKELGFVQDVSSVKPAKQEKKQNLEKPSQAKLKTRPEKWQLPSHFSFTQLSAFNTCPYQYKLAHILKVPLRGKASFSFGKTIHNTLDEFLRGYFQKTSQTQDNLFGFNNNNATTGKISGDSGGRANASLEDLLELYEKNWLDEWYESKKQKEDYKKLGRENLKDFYKAFVKTPPKIMEINGQLALEINFHIKVSDYMIRGKIDRIDQVSGGVKLIDYKTGKAKEKLAKSDKTQLLLYQVAAEEFWGLTPVELSYYYLENNTEVSFLATEKEKQTLKQEIAETIEKIKKSDFKATPGFQCQFCDFKAICQFASGEE